MNLVYVDATEDFLTRLATVVDPEEKRRAIGTEFIRVFDREAARVGHVDFLTQGTLYPDVIESKTADSKVSAKIKTHHNVGGLPENMKLELVEPLRYLFKDEVREVQNNYECGMAFENYNDIKQGDVIECYEVEEVQRQP